MQFLLTAFDGTDSEALARRMAARPDHLASSDRLIAAGQLLYAAAILGDEGQMIGSVEVLNFPTREDVDAYVVQEPYVVQGVWERIDIRPCKPGPAFQQQTESQQAST